ncbi:MAG: GDP-mannose 4,6-dehydratase [Planctomycetes bacterium]|nr:GDP-mannose 4,6-dehydratase [Planctomycetota bacterium]
MKKALITGVNGFSGIHLAEFLLGQKVSVCGIDISPKISHHYKIRTDIKYIKLDILDAKAVSKVIRDIKPDYIFHLAGLLKGDNLAEFLKVNVQGTQNILEAAYVVKSKVLISGSAAEYGIVSSKELPINEETPPRPIGFYGISKLAQTMLGYQYFITRGMPVCLTRVFNMTGPGEKQSMFCSSVAQQIKRIAERTAKPVIYVGNITPKRDFIDVRDVVRAYWAIINKGKIGRIYNICSGKAYAMKDIIKMMGKIARVKKLVIKPDPRKVRAIDIPVHKGDYSALRKDTGWKPAIKLEQTLKDILQFV